MRTLIAIVAAVVFFSAHAESVPIKSETVETIPSRDSYTQTFLITRVEKPLATLIMYPGNKGYLGIYPNGSAQFDMFFVYRARKMLAEQGFNVMLLDAPSEWGSRGIWEKQRSAEYAAHNAAAINYARQQANAPVFLLGGSVGAIAAVGVATQLKEKGADGLILVSPWMPPKEKWPIPNFVFSSDFAIPSWPDLADIKGPILLVHHLDDNCNFSLPDYVPGLVSALAAARKPVVVGLRGGALPSGNPCYPAGWNNFTGMEREVVDIIGNWMKSALTAKAH
jgi:pimeloyl-ACP methyl ester carboxylesterase